MFRMRDVEPTRISCGQFYPRRRRFRPPLGDDSLKFSEPEASSQSELPSVTARYVSRTPPALGRLHQLGYPGSILPLKSPDAMLDRLMTPEQSSRTMTTSRMGLSFRRFGSAWLASLRRGVGLRTRFGFGAFQLLGLGPFDRGAVIGLQSRRNGGTVRLHL